MNAEERKNILAGKGTAPKRTQPGQGGKKPGKPAEPTVTLGQAALSWGKTILIALAIVMVVQGLLVASFVVPTGSMENEVMAGDFVFVNKFIYGGSTPQTIPFVDVPLPFLRLPGIREPEKGDVIVFIFPGFRDEVKSEQFQYYLKRCVATAGDTLEVRNAQVHINGKPQANPRNVNFGNNDPGPGDKHNTFPEGAGFTRDNWGPMRIPKKGDVIPLNDSTLVMYRVFIMREGHEVSQNGEIVSVDGKPATSYTVERDYCFGMGDNRNNSLDSRYWGFIPVEDVVGTPLMVYWSWSPDIPVTKLFAKLGSIRWGRIFNGIQ